MMCAKLVFFKLVLFAKLYASFKAQLKFTFMNTILIPHALCCSTIGLLCILKKPMSQVHLALLLCPLLHLAKTNQEERPKEEHPNLNKTHI